MTTNAVPLPDMARPDAGFIVTREFTVARPEVQRLSADALIDAWDHVPWPDVILSVSVALGTDGVSIHHYVQWTSQDAFDAFVADGRSNPAPYIVPKTPEMTMSTQVQYTLYRSARNDLPDPLTLRHSKGEPGCIVVINIEFDGPDAQRQRDWVDAVFEALAQDEGASALPPGGLAAHFHISLDGTRVLNVAEWADEASHIAALDRDGGQSIGEGAPWERVQRWPGLKGSSFKRFTPYRLRTADALSNARP